MQKKKIYSLFMAVLATTLFASNASLAKSAHASHANHESSSSAHYSDQGSDRQPGSSSLPQEDIPQVPVEVIRPRAEGQKLDAFSVGKAANAAMRPMRVLWATAARLIPLIVPSFLRRTV